MNAPYMFAVPNGTGSRTDGARTDADWARILVRVALAVFWSRALPRDRPLYPMLEEEIRRFLHLPSEIAPVEDGQDPGLLIQQALRALGTGESPLARLVREEGLGDAALLILCLVGEVETSHLVDMVLADLQSPAGQPRPTRHLCDILAGVLPTTEVQQGPQDPVRILTDLGLVSLEGDGPMPLRTLRMVPALWDVLCGVAPRWPGCTPLPRSDPNLIPEALLARLPNLARMLGEGEIQTLVLRGGPGSGRAETATEIAGLLDRIALEVPVETWLGDGALRLACGPGRMLAVLRPALGPGEALALPRDALEAPCILLLGDQGAVSGGGSFEIDMPLPARVQRRVLWSENLEANPGAVVGLAEALTPARLSGPLIQRIAADARRKAEQAGTEIGFSQIAAARRDRAADGLRLLAQPLTREVGPEALVLPHGIAVGVEEVVLRATQREALWEGLGPTLAATPNPGVRALFAGESGTGKTLAAGYVATRLGAPLFRVDLSAVMNKYIGESEKNLGLLLDRAAAADVVLLFDEADSVFGRRTDGRETGERYANMLTDFLLSRIETHPGIVVLTTNSRERIDQSFTRRLDVIVEFPLPAFEQRMGLWRSHLGARGPGEEACRFLASACELSGGQIRNAVLTAAAHSDGGAIGISALYLGVQAEYRKLGRGEPAKLTRWGGGSATRQSP